MIGFYLITGFLGAGKTTFLKEFVKFLSDKRIFLIINEFGKEGIDGALLSEVGAVIDEISNGSVFCSCRIDVFEDTLKKACEAAPDIIIVEASGLSDPTSIGKILSQPDYAGNIAYKGGICLVDTVNFERAFYTAISARKQLAAANLIILTKSDIASEMQIKRTISLIEDIVPDLMKDFAINGDYDFERLLSVIPSFPDCGDITSRDLTMQKEILDLNDNITREKLFEILDILKESTFRMKGFVNLFGENMLVDSVNGSIEVTPYIGDILPEKKNRLVLLATEGMELRKSLKKVKTLLK